MRTIIESLADRLLLSEDLNSKMPILRKQFPEYSEEDITAMSAADPTAPQAADYITWLLKMRKAGYWDGSAEVIRPHLQRFHAIKNAADFKPCPDVPMQGNDHKNILKYTSPEALEKVLEFNRDAGNKAQKANKGVTPLAKSGDLSLLKIDNKDAAVKIAIGKGTNGSPETVWCTRNPETAQGFLNDGPLFIVYKAGAPYVLTHIDLKRPSSSQCKIGNNSDITPAIAAELAPLFVSAPAPTAAQVTSLKTDDDSGLTDSDIANQIVKTKYSFWSERLHGVLADGREFKKMTPEQIQPRWTNALPRLREKILAHIQSGNLAVFERSRSSSTMSKMAGPGALSAAIKRLMPKDENVIPACLRSVEAFIAFEAEVAKGSPEDGFMRPPQ